MVATKQHCYYCFESILERLSNYTPKEFEFGDKEYPLFVTWKKSNSLRGCIGSFSSLPLKSGLRQYANISAFQDARFRPIAEHEVPDLSCTVSLLYSFEECANYLDWEVGVHGLCMSFKHYSGTYLPNIALEQGWDKLETLKSLLRKAGYTGKVTPQVLREIELVRYQSAKAEASYFEYLANCG